MSNPTQTETLAEAALEALIATMSVQAPDRATNARRILGAIERGQVPGVILHPDYPDGAA